MLESLEIANFQIHKHLEVTFDKSTTTIIGPSDVGKSAILRALKWVCLNTPQGDGFIREGSKGTTVTLKIDGHEIRRIRNTDGTNSYELDGQEFKAFGTRVPDEISKLISVGLLNFCGQHESPFWFTLSAGEVSRELNSIVDLGIIDETLYKIGQRVRKHRDELQICQERLSKSRIKKEALDWAVECDKELQKLEDLEAQYAAKNKRRDALEAIVASTTRLESDRRKSTEFLTDVAIVGRLGASYLRSFDKSSNILSVLSVIEKQKLILQKGVFDVTHLAPIVTAYEKMRFKIDSLTYHLKQIRTIKSKIKKIPDFSGIELAVSSYKEVRFRRQRMSDLLITINGLKDTLNKSKAAYKKAVETLEESTHGLCPVCGSLHESGCPAIV